MSPCWSPTGGPYRDMLGDLALSVRGTVDASRCLWYLFTQSGRAARLLGAAPQNTGPTSLTRMELR